MPQVDDNACYIFTSPWKLSRKFLWTFVGRKNRSWDTLLAKIMYSWADTLLHYDGIWCYSAPNTLT